MHHFVRCPKVAVKLFVIGSSWTSSGIRIKEGARETNPCFAMDAHNAFLDRRTLEEIRQKGAAVRLNSSNQADRDFEVMLLGNLPTVERKNIGERDREREELA